jgi:hypothetical protein
MTPIMWVISGGTVAGVLDITYACVFWAIKRGLPPSRIFQSVAAGLLGDASFQGGTRTATLGLALHFFIALTMAIVFWLASRRWPLLVARPLLASAAYGVVLYLVMNFVVVPLSAARPSSKDPVWIALSLLVHMFLIGVPIAYGARAAARAQPPIATVR